MQKRKSQQVVTMDYSSLLKHLCVLNRHRGSDEVGVVKHVCSRPLPPVLPIMVSLLALSSHLMYADHI